MNSLLFLSLITIAIATNNNNNNKETIVIVEEPPSQQLVCGPNEVFTDCVTPCQPSCDFPNQLPCPEFNSRSNQNSVQQLIIVKPSPHIPCFGGCICAEGFVRNDFGVCIPRSQCTVPCKPNSHFEFCGPRCQPTCELAEPRGHSCNELPDVCVSGCFCNSGYVKDLRTGQCVRPKDCSQICPENEHYSDCGTICVATCEQPTFNWAHCANQTVELPGCYCNQGYVRNKMTKRCIRHHHCIKPKPKPKPIKPCNH